MRTQVAIIGGGPAGMLLAEILHLHQIRSVVLEKHSRAHVLARIRAGVLEPSTVGILQRHGLGARLQREGRPHDGMLMVWAQRGSLFVDTLRHTGQRMTTYGQTSIQEDLFAAADARESALITEVQDVRVAGIDSAQPSLTFTHNGRVQRLDCDFIAGCDGFHGVARSAIPANAVREYVKTYPYAWLGVLARVPPLPDITYAHHPRGFALASSRSDTVSRYYIQTPPAARIEDWPDERFWDELKLRYPPDYARHIVAGPAIEKSLTTLRSVVIEPMQRGRLFLAGDAAHIVPPTGAKGLNLAVSDVYYLSRALIAHTTRAATTACLSATA
jgi:p-hydroxybenzoate 3-monooxygenase